MKKIQGPPDTYHPGWGGAGKILAAPQTRERLPKAPYRPGSPPHERRAVEGAGGWKNYRRTPPPLGGAPHLGGVVHASTQGVGLGADPWGRPHLHTLPPPQWQPSIPPAPQPPQVVTRGRGAPTGLASLGLSYATLQAFSAALQGVVTAGVVSSLPSPAPATPEGKVTRLSLLHLRFACGVVGDRDLPPIWDVVLQGRGKMEGLATLNQDMMRGLQSCRQVS